MLLSRVYVMKFELSGEFYVIVPYLVIKFEVCQQCFVIVPCLCKEV